MKVILSIFLSLLLIFISTATPESLTMGPYNVSFDLNTTQTYKINNTLPPSYGETYSGKEYVLYEAFIIGENDLLGFFIAHYCPGWDKIYISDELSDVENALRENSHSIESYERKIDGQTGVIGVGEDDDDERVTFVAQYWPMLNVSGSTKVRIVSKFPWEEGTLSLLKTIHIEMINQTS